MVIPSLIGNCIPVALTLLVILVCFAEDWCSKHFPHCPVSWFWPIRFSCLNCTWCIPVFLALSTTVVSAPWKNTEVFVALLSGRSCRCTWALWVDDPRNTCRPSVEKNQPPNSKSTLVFNGFSKHWDRGRHGWYTMVKCLLIRPVGRQHSIA